MIDYSHYSNKLAKIISTLNKVEIPSVKDGLVLIDLTPVSPFMNQLQELYHKIRDKAYQDSEAVLILAQCGDVSNLLDSMYIDRLNQLKSLITMLGYIHTAITEIQNNQKSADHFNTYIKLAEAALNSDHIENIEVKLDVKAMAEIKQSITSLSFPVDPKNLDKSEENLKEIISRYLKHVNYLQNQLEELPFQLDQGDHSVVHVLGDLRQELGRAGVDLSSTNNKN